MGLQPLQQASVGNRTPQVVPMLNKLLRLLKKIYRD